MRGAEALAGVLGADGCGLEELHLPSNKLGAEGAALIANSLVTNTSLRFLNLWGNEIGACNGTCE